ncbi:MAG: putative metal-dependent hydrolase [Ignavibacteriales bacterium]|nr:putative metal-dependent hydrolase [Ignavibacteriales bacterium]
MNDIRFPIGKFQNKETITETERIQCIQHIADCPQILRAVIRGFSDEQFNTPYRDGGWTVKQVVHHLADSHMNAYVRFKLALTENEPLIKTYEESLWAELFDAKNARVETSLQLLESLHTRWVMFLRSLSPTDFSKTFRHPDSGIKKIDFLVQMYAWHSQHHVAHITSLRERMGWK